MEPYINILNLTLVNQTVYAVNFQTNFQMNNLFYELSQDGITWSTPIQLPGTTSPQNITSNTMLFRIRLSSNYTESVTNGIHTSVFTQVFN